MYGAVEPEDPPPVALWSRREDSFCGSIEQSRREDSFCGSMEP